MFLNFQQQSFLFSFFTNNIGVVMFSECKARFGRPFLRYLSIALLYSIRCHQDFLGTIYHCLGLCQFGKRAGILFRTRICIFSWFYLITCNILGTKVVITSSVANLKLTLNITGSLRYPLYHSYDHMKWSFFHRLDETCTLSYNIFKINTLFFVFFVPSSSFVFTSSLNWSCTLMIVQLKLNL